MAYTGSGFSQRSAAQALWMAPPRRSRIVDLHGLREQGNVADPSRFLSFDLVGQGELTHDVTRRLRRSFIQELESKLREYLHWAFASVTAFFCHRKDHVTMMMTRILRDRVSPPFWGGNAATGDGKKI